MDRAVTLYNRVVLDDNADGQLQKDLAAVDDDGEIVDTMGANEKEHGRFCNWLDFKLKTGCKTQKKLHAMWDDL